MDLRFVPPENPDFSALTAKLDAYYIELVGDVHLRYAPFNLPHLFAARAVAYEAGEAIACGCWKDIAKDAAEIKRIYVLPQHRRKGAASRIITALEADIAHAGKRRIVLETARTTADSEALYLSLGYREIDYYGSPAGADNCRCFEKLLF